MSRISGTVSRTIPLDPVIGRVLSLSGTFDLYVSQSELQNISSILDCLVASGILTNHNRHQESDSLIASVTAPVVDTTTTGIAVPYPLQIVPIPIPDAAGTTYTITAAKRIELVNTWVHKIGAGTGTAYQIQDATGAAITDAAAATADKSVVRMATIDHTKNVIEAGAVFKVAVTRSTGSSQAQLFLQVILR